MLDRVMGDDEAVACRPLQADLLRTDRELEPVLCSSRIPSPLSGTQYFSNSPAASQIHARCSGAAASGFDAIVAVSSASIYRYQSAFEYASSKSSAVLLVSIPRGSGTDSPALIAAVLPASLRPTIAAEAGESTVQRRGCRCTVDWQSHEKHTCKCVDKLIEFCPRVSELVVRNSCRSTISQPILH
jgi:hypothetical protein